jgi:hypothetical protein
MLFADDGASDEWIYFVVTGMARDAATKDVVPFSAVLLMDFHLPGPLTTLPEAQNVGLGGKTAGQSSRARQRIVDVRVGVDLGGASCPAHTTAGAALHGPAAPITAGLVPSALIPEAAALTDSETVYVVATGPLEEALSTSAASMVAMEPVTLDQLRVIGRDVDTGVSYGLVAQRTIPAVILHGDNGTGIIGQSDTGNGYKYYSVPRYTVSGNLTALDCKGSLLSLEVDEALGWLDHQWGTIALPYTAEQREEQALYVKLGGQVPLVDRGFGIVGVEIWFAFQLTDVAHGMPQLLQGGVVTGNIVELAGFGTLVDLPFNGRVGFANGTSADVHGTINATATTLCSAEMAKAGQCDPTKPPAGETVYCTGFAVDLPSLGVTGDARMMLSSVSPDHSMRFATGQPFWEGGALIRCAGCADADPLSGFAFVEQIGWDVNGTRDILKMAGVASPDDGLVHAADKDYNFATS